MSTLRLIPRLYAYRGGGQAWWVWCRHCRTWHMHVARTGWVLAGCGREDSPYGRTGYVLVDSGLLTERVVRAYRRVWLRLAS